MIPSTEPTSRPAGPAEVWDGPEVVLVTSGAALARQVEHVLSTRELGNPRSGEGAYRFLCTGDTDAFHELGTRFLQMPLGVVEHVELAEAEAVA